MTRKTRVYAFAFYGVFLASLASYLYLANKPQPSETMSVVQKALVFRRNLSAGQILNENDLRWVVLNPGAFLHGDAVLTEADRLAVVGARLSQPVVAGELVHKSSYLQKPDKALLSQKLNPGFRALTIQADTAQLASGRLVPEDHVDVLLAPPGVQQGGPLALSSLSVQAAGAANVSRLYENVRVLAIAGVIEPPDAAEGKMDSSLLKDATITLELRPDQAERVLAASAVGKIVLLVRRPFDPLAEARPDRVMGPRWRPRSGELWGNKPVASANLNLSPTSPAPQDVIIIRGTN